MNFSSTAAALHPGTVVRRCARRPLRQLTGASEPLPICVESGYREARLARSSCTGLSVGTTLRRMNAMTRLSAIAAALVVTGLLGFGVGISVGQEKTANSTVYELRTYKTLPDRLPALHKRFAEHTIKLFEAHGIRSVMYWVPTDDARKDNTLIYILAHDSQEAAEKNRKKFKPDREWVKSRGERKQD